MSEELTQASLAAWARRSLPARLNVEQTAKLLGFAEHDIQILTAAGRLVALGDPAPNAPKWYAAVEVVRLAMDQEWLHKSTRVVTRHWLQKRCHRADPNRPGARIAFPNQAQDEPDQSSEQVKQRMKPHSPTHQTAGVTA